MTPKLPVIGDLYTAQNPIDFWSKWFPGNPFTQIYHTVGGYKNHEKAVAVSFLASGVYHDLFVNGLVKSLINGDGSNATWGDWTIWFAIQGVPVALRKSYYSRKARKKAGELSTLVERYSSSKPEEVIDKLGLNLSDEYTKRLKYNIQNYSKGRNDTIDVLVSNSQKYLKETLLEGRNKEHLLPDVVRKPLNTVLTLSYVIGSFVAVHEGLKYLYDKF